MNGREKDDILDSISISKWENDHDKNTLPVGLERGSIDRPVMYVAPASSEAGLRSKDDQMLVVNDSGAAGAVPKVQMVSSVTTTGAERAMRARKYIATQDSHLASENLSNVIECPISKSDGIEIVKKARNRLVAYVEARRLRRDTAPSTATLADYEKKCREIDSAVERMPSGEPNPIFSVMIEHARQRKTFTAYKAALKHRAIKRLVSTMSEQNGIQRAEGKEAEWVVSIAEVRKALFAYDSIERLNFSECLLWSDREQELPQSKKKDLSKLKSNWRRIFLDANLTSTKYRFAAVLLNFCGLRPRELELGVEVVDTQAGIEITIKGAKVRATAGQPWRKFILAPSCLPMWFVDEVYRNKRMTVVAKADALRSHLKRQSSLVFRDSRNSDELPPVLSAYIFRHALVTNLREQGWSSAEIAAVIGDSTAQMVSSYGTRTRTIKVAPKEIAIIRSSVDAARTVRKIDMSALNLIVQNEEGPARGL